MRLIKQSNVNKRIKYQSTKQVLLLSAWLLGSVCEEAAIASSDTSWIGGLLSDDAK